MKNVTVIALLALVTAQAFAQTAAPLNLDLPASAPAPSSDPADPDSPAFPGKYYGDGSDSDSLIDRTMHVSASRPHGSRDRRGQTGKTSRRP